MCSSIQKRAGYGETCRPKSAVLLSQHAALRAPRTKLWPRGLRPGLVYKRREEDIREETIGVIAPGDKRKQGASKMAVYTIRGYKRSEEVIIREEIV